MHAHALGACPFGVRTIHTVPLMCPDDDSYPSGGRVVAVDVAGTVKVGEHGSE